ncbi:hypothetical protein SELMODRAFT_102874 [Selaginella moellendorffii]|uniref:OPA3-like protein n=1 Tax=Selaginella moellendorffii TaxID=88036 RepID=D8RVS4_SELML|nr:optic atrophy 3 protein homolog [Selaginella moellendorffii]EFJ24008.1 hypothetical protein SELMODRAFT_102874 [Selaginella moellendorffii]|eukprot:XP_002975223.1 optic atrophy 3 protein homolog [Selaginella moellendorffii]
MIFPLMKLATLALRTLSKPVANRLKKTAAHHPRFRESISKMAQLNHRFSVNLQRRIYGHATDVEIRPLNEEKAVQAASEMLGEFFIFGVGGAVVIFEVSRNARSEEAKRKEEARKEDERRMKEEAIMSRISGVETRLDVIEELLRGRG